MLRTTSAPFASAFTVLFSGFEEFPAASHFSFELRGGAVLKRFIVEHQVEANAVDTVGGVDGGFDFRETPIKGLQEGEGERSVMKGGAKAHLKKRIPERGVTVFGNMADPVGAVTGTILNRVIADEGPDLGGAAEALDRANAGHITSGIILTQAGDRDDVAGRSLGDQRDQVTAAFLNQSFSVDILLKEAMELLGQGSGHVRGR